MNTVTKLLALCLVPMLVGCATAAQFKLPAGTDIKFDTHDKEFASGDVSVLPFGWKASSGIDYSLTRKGKVVKSGKLPAKFRIVSIFWPPIYGIIAWPMGFKGDCFDLTGGSAKTCTVEPKKTSEPKKTK